MSTDDVRTQVREFLSSRRAQITPEQAGLPGYGGGHRRVPGLRREEVALLAGVSVDYYVRLERGNLAGASESVLDALTSALQLDEAEREHLFALARAAGPPSRQRKPAAKKVRPVVQQILDAMTEAPAWVRNGRHDILAMNQLARELYSPVLSSPVAGLGARRYANTTRYVYLDPSSQEFFRDWDVIANDAAAMLRLEAGLNPHDRELIELVGELSTCSDLFRRRWASQDVKLHRSGRKRFRHPLVGDLDLNYEGLDLPSEPGLRFNVYTADPGTPSAANLSLLASWASKAPARTTQRS